MAVFIDKARLDAV